MSLATVAQGKQMGVLPEEFQKIEEILGRTPNFTELSIFSVMWSEHCSYKNSITWLKTLPRKGERLLVEAGDENAGLVDIGDGLACAFKIESHNHPSALEPHQGAATGVGGIHRDIFTMGARPIAALNSLRFGDLHTARTQHLLKGVVEGIGSYGNCFGVPTVGGEVYFNSCYNQNILVNAMSVGTVRIGETVSATAGTGIGNPVFIVGSATGKDGIHGATFASGDLTEDSVKDLPAVQVGDPFQEKLLLEATLEAIKTGAIVGMQDMGAAGITCSTSEMSAKSGVGMWIDLSKVPTRQANMKPFEILLSESQERMLIVAEKGKEHLLQAVFDKWDLECAEIGEVTDTGRLHFYMNGELVADVPAEPLVLGGGAPVYQRDYTEPAYLQHVKAFDMQNIADIENLEALKTVAKVLTALPNIASKRWIYEQYDSMVRTNTLTTNMHSDAAVVRVKGTEKALVVTTDCNSAYVYADPEVGAMIAVAEAARNIVCTGGKPVAITNCLNFGNPYNTEVYWQFVNVIKGMGAACAKFGTPVTGGNVSFYNQSTIGGDIVPVYPTPTIGMLGMLDDVSKLMTLDFKAAGDLIYLIGEPQNDLGSSEYLQTIKNVQHSNAPYFKLEAEFELQTLIAELIETDWLLSAHDVSEGGLFTTLLESAMVRNLGFAVKNDPDFRLDAYWFGEAQSRVVVSIEADRYEEFEAQLWDSKISFCHVGEVTEGIISIDTTDFGTIDTWKTAYNTTIEKVMA
jgi:phosphoribosylformylglycinamidine synthase